MSNKKPSHSANADLIAAALQTAAESERLKEINTELVVAMRILLGDSDQPEHRYMADKINLARAAIARAKGGAP